MSTPNNSEVDNPKHYTMGKIEVIDFIEDQILPYHAACAIKYICRYRYKGTPITDLRKAVWYLNRLIDNLAKEEKLSPTSNEKTFDPQSVHDIIPSYFDREPNGKVHQGIRGIRSTAT